MDGEPKMPSMNSAIALVQSKLDRGWAKAHDSRFLIDALGKREPVNEEEIALLQSMCRLVTMQLMFNVFSDLADQINAIKELDQKRKDTP